jgi:hypothetical protein
LRPKTTIFAAAEKAFTPQNQIDCSGLRQRRAATIVLATWFNRVLSAERRLADHPAGLPAWQNLWQAIAPFGGAALIVHAFVIAWRAIRG